MWWVSFICGSSFIVSLPFQQHIYLHHNYVLKQSHDKEEVYQWQRVKAEPSRGRMETQCGADKGCLTPTNCTMGPTTHHHCILIIIIIITIIITILSISQRLYYQPTPRLKYEIISNEKQTDKASQLTFINHVWYHHHDQDEVIQMSSMTKFTDASSSTKIKHLIHSYDCN